MAEITKKDLDKQTKEFGRYFKMLSEDFRSQIRPVAEVQQEHTKKLDEHTKKLDEHSEKLDEHSKKLDTLFGMVAKNTEDIAIIKSDISFIKQELKIKVDRDEFTALEKRVILLERKLRRA